MVLEKVSNISKVWFRFSKTALNGKPLKFRWEQLPEHRFEEFLDFKMNYFVKHEITHIAAGVYKNPKAMEEYKHLLSLQLKDPLYYNAICCLDDESEKIVAFNSLKLFRKDDNYEDTTPAETPEVKRFFQIVNDWNDICPLPDLMDKYGVDSFMDDRGGAVHSDYRNYGMSYKINLLRYIITQANGVPLTGAWLSSIATQISTHHDGWETVFEISSEEVGKILRVNFENAPPKFVFKIKKCD